MFTKLFWVKAAERAVKTVAQAGLSIGTAGVTGIVDVNWVTAGSVALFAGMYSVMTSLVSSGVSDSSSPSLVKE